MDTPAPILRDQREVDSGQLKIVAIFYYVTAGISLLGIGFLYVHYLIFSNLILNPKFMHPAPAFPIGVMAALKWVYLGLGVLVLVFGILNFLAAGFISRRENRTAILVVAGINCLHFPFGAILGVVTFYLMQRDTVRMQFDEVEAGKGRGDR